MKAKFHLRCKGGKLDKEKTNCYEKMKTKVVGGIVLKSQATAINLVILNISISPRCLENYRFNNRNMLCRILKHWKKSSFEPYKREEKKKGQKSLRSWYNLKGRRKQ